ncbi:MAG: response regulator transcription factor [Candidatus Methylumidiphilus sp.]
MPAHSTPPPRVAVIDDEESVRFGLRSLLEAQGYAVELFTSAEDFLAEADPCGYLCVLLDLWLRQRMNGLELLRQLAPLGLSAPAVVMMTERGDIPTALQAGQLGVMDYLPKPVLPSQLDAVLRQAQARQSAPRPVSVPQWLESLPRLMAWVGALTQAEWKRLLEDAAPKLPPQRLRQLASLTHREAQVFARMAACGAANKEIAREFDRDEKTIGVYCDSVREKLDLHGLNARAAALRQRDILLELLGAAGKLC